MPSAPRKSGTSAVPPGNSSQSAAAPCGPRAACVLPPVWRRTRFPMSLSAGAGRTTRRIDSWKQPDSDFSGFASVSRGHSALSVWCGGERSGVWRRHRRRTISSASARCRALCVEVRRRISPCGHPERVAAWRRAVARGRSRSACRSSHCEDSGSKCRCCLVPTTARWTAASGTSTGTALPAIGRQHGHRRSPGWFFPGAEGHRRGRPDRSRHAAARSRSIASSEPGWSTRRTSRSSTRRRRAR